MPPRQTPPPAGSARSTAARVQARIYRARCARGRLLAFGGIPAGAAGACRCLRPRALRCGCWTPPATRHAMRPSLKPSNRSMGLSPTDPSRPLRAAGPPRALRRAGGAGRRVLPGVRTAGGPSDERFHPRHPARPPRPALRRPQAPPDVAARLFRTRQRRAARYLGPPGRPQRGKRPGQEPGRLPDADGDQPRAGPPPARPPLYERGRGGHADARHRRVPRRGRRRPWPPATRWRRWRG